MNNSIRLLTILGSTGSIGDSTLDVVHRHPDRFKILALTAHSNVKKMLVQCNQFKPQFAVMLDPASAQQLKEAVSQAKLDTVVLSGVESLEKVASLPEVDVVMAAIVGAAGIRPTFAAAQAGKLVLLANKETLVMAGRIFMDVVKKHHAILLPIDSEHNAIHQSLPQDFNGNLVEKGIKRILLTASGGPFRTLSRDLLVHVTPEQACAHPNWDMGRKISVDSATMMNKGLEVIEAHWLFNAPPTTPRTNPPRAKSTSASSVIDATCVPRCMISEATMTDPAAIPSPTQSPDMNVDLNTPITSLRSVSSISPSVKPNLYK